MSLTEFTNRRYSETNVALPPIWVGNTLKSAEGFMSWFQSTLPILENIARPTIEDAWSNLLWYTGEYVPLMPMQLRSPDGRITEVPRQLAPFVVNYLAYLTDKRAADLSVYKANHDTAPEDESEDDRMAARVMKVIVRHIKRFNNADMLFDKAEKWNMVFSHIYLGVDWNDKIGDRKKAKSPDREGEVELKIIDPWHILLWPSRHYEQCPCAIQIEEIIHVEEARKKYNNENIQATKADSLFQFQSVFKEEIRPDEVVIYRTVYKPDEFLPQGAVIRSTSEMVISGLGDKVYPWSHEDFPWVRYTDIDVPGRLYPISFYQHVKPLQHAYNNLSGLIKKYIYTTAHPKWAVTRGSCNLKSLGNAAAIIQHRAGMPPNLQQIKPIGPDPFNFRTSLKDEMTLMSGSHQIGLGDLPPNTRSGIMISRLQEIENKQRGPQIDKRNDFMGRVLLLSASVAGDHYPLQSEARIKRVVGRDMVEEVKALASDKVSAQYTITIVNPSGFSSEMTGRLEEISFINKEIDPSLLTRQQKLDIIGAGLEDKYYDATTASLRLSQKENDMMNDGVMPPEPELEEDHITHWNEHYLDMQTMTHKRLPEKIKKMKQDHMMAHEMLMEQLGANPSYGQRLMQLDGFPRFYVITPQPTQEETSTPVDPNIVPSPDAPPPPDQSQQGGQGSQPPPQG